MAKKNTRNKNSNTEKKVNSKKHKRTDPGKKNKKGTGPRTKE